LTRGYIIKIGSRAISWSSKLQGIVALLSTEAKYLAAVEAGKEVCWMKNLLFQMEFTNDTLSSLHINNQLAIQVKKSRTI